MGPEAQAFPLNQLPEVAADIAEHFGAEGLVEPGEKIVIGAPIAVYTGSMVDASDPPASLRDAVFWTGRFHHQVLTEAARPLGYALTQLHDDVAIVCKISGSCEFARAVEHGLNSLRERFTGERTVRLLSVPELQIEALWLVERDAAESEILVVIVPEESRLAALTRVSEADFLEVLMTHSPLAGAFVGLDDDLRDVELRELVAGSLGEEGETSDAPPVTWSLVQIMEVAA